MLTARILVQVLNVNWMAWGYVSGSCFCVYGACFLTIVAVMQSECCVMCILWWRRMSMCGCTQMRLLSHCLPQRQMVFECSSRNRGCTDWWGRRALAVPSMNMELPLSQCTIIETEILTVPLSLLLSLFIPVLSSQLSLLFSAVKDDHNQEYRGHRHGPHRDLRPADQ